MASYRAGFEEDDRLRSRFIREVTLLQLARDRDTLGIDSSGDQGDHIPMTLVQYWHDPQEVPADVQECLDSWEVVREQGVSMLMFDDDSATAYIEDRYGSKGVAAFKRCRHPAMRSDYFRMCFLLAEGGLYVDADDVVVGDGWRDAFHGNRLKVQPFCYDVRVGGMVSSAELRRFDLSTDGRIFYVNNNPIAAPAGHPVLRRALSRANRILLGEDLTPEIQSTTGPGNLTASLAAHAFELQESGAQPDFELLLDWETTAESRWDLGYRSDARNWRNMGRG